MKAPDFLNAGLRHMQDRAATYDKPDTGERSMAATVSAFNALTGHTLTEQQGWLMMVLLKCARSQQGAFRADNYEDLAAYAGLMGEAAHKAGNITVKIDVNGPLRDLAERVAQNVPRRSDTRFASGGFVTTTELAEELQPGMFGYGQRIMRKLGWGEVVNNEVPQGYRVFQAIDGNWWCAPPKAVDPPEEYRYRNEDKL